MLLVGTEFYKYPTKSLVLNTIIKMDQIKGNADYNKADYKTLNVQRKDWNRE